MSKPNWTVASLAAHLDKMINLILARLAEIEAQWERSVDLAREAAKQEREVAARQLDARLEGMNEFREQMRDQAAKFVTRREAWAMLAGAVGLAAAIATAVGMFVGAG
jgi:hypothetical protein